MNAEFSAVVAEPAKVGPTLELKPLELETFELKAFELELIVNSFPPV